MQLLPVKALFLIYQFIGAGKKVTVDRIACHSSVQLNEGHGIPQPR